jgi:regulatory protein
MRTPAGKITHSSRSTEVEEGKGALAYALRALARRDHSEAELARKLRDRGVAAALAEDVIARLREAGYLDDRRFARQWAEAAVRGGRGYGPRLRQELSRRGVPDEVVAETLAAVTGEYGELETLTALLATKFAGFDPAAAPDREKRRVVHYLQRRGFSVAAIFQVFRMTEGC